MEEVIFLNKYPVYLAEDLEGLYTWGLVNLYEIFITVTGQAALLRGYSSLEFFLWCLA